MFCAVTKIHCSYKETLQLQRNIILFLAWLYKYLYSWILLKYRVVVSLFIINFIIRIIVNDKFFIVKKLLCVQNFQNFIYIQTRRVPIIRASTIATSKTSTF